MTEKKEYSPSFSVTAEGKDITAVLQKNLQEITVTDYGGVSEKSDELKITVTSESLRLPKKGVRLRVALGFNGSLVDKGLFVVSRVSSSGPPRKVEIYATAAPMNGEKGAGMVQCHKTRSWDDVTLGEIVATVAKNNGLIPRVAKKFNDIRLEHLDQVAESDANLLTRLARTYGAVSKPSGGYWLFLEQGASQTASGKGLPEVTVFLHEMSSWSYSEGDKSSSGEKSDKKGKITYRYFDEADGKTKKASVEHNGPDIESPFTHCSKQIAQTKAASKKEKTQNKERQMSMSGPCRLRHLAISAEARITTKGFGEEEDRTWITESVSWALNSKGLTFSVSLGMTPKDSGKKDSKGSKAGPDYFGEKKGSDK